MKRNLTLLLLSSTLTGCVQRTITVTSEPPGAIVSLNDEEVGRTPVTVPFTFYGTYDVRLELAGYQTLHVAQKANGPWWENPGPDLVAEALPGKRRVNLDWFYTLTPLQLPAESDLLDRANELRSRSE